MNTRITTVVAAVFLLAAVLTLPLDDVSRAGKRGKKGKRGKVVVPAWVKGLVTKDTPVRGAAKPDLVVVEFSDYECPFCFRAHEKMLKVLKKYGKRIRFYYRHYPLDNTCNRTMKSPMHLHACLAARAAICAHAQGKFWSFHNQLNLLRAKLSPSAIYSIAKTVKLRLSKYKRCLKSARTRRILQADLAAGNKAKLVGTPTFYAGGTHIKRFQFSSPSVAQFDKIFAKLDKQRKKKPRRRR